jgi:hypothetical protein
MSYNIGLEHLLGGTVIYLCPKCYSLAYFPLLSPRDARMEREPLARCSKTLEKCSRLIAIKLGGYDVKERRIPLHAETKGGGLDSSMEPSKSKAMANL